MTQDEDMERVDRHALALTIWLAAGVVASTLYHYGVRAGGWPFIVAAFAVIAAAFAGHVIVNVVFRSEFSVRERALGLVCYAVLLIIFGLATLVSSDFANRAFLPTSAGLVALLAVIVFSMVVKSGVRSSFEAFDIIRSFSAHDAWANGGDRAKGGARE